MDSKHRIRLKTKIFTYSEYRDSPDALLGLLSHAYAEKIRAICLCSENFPELYITPRFEKFYLAKMPDTGPFHDVHCAFYESPLDQSGRAGYAEGAIVDRGDVVDVKLGVPLSRARHVEKAASPLGEKRAVPTLRRHAVELLGLLHFLWEQSSNHRWFPIMRGMKVTSRRWSSVTYFLGRTLDNIHCKGKPLKESLFLVSQFDKNKPDAIGDEFSTVMASVVSSGSELAEKKNRPIEMKMILGEIKAVTKSQYGYELRFRGFAQSFYIREQLFQKIQKSYTSGVVAIESNTDAKCIAIAVISASKKGYFNIESMALMPVNQNYIPFDSSYEKTIADALIIQERQFEKPLRYDNTALTLPDFILLDGDQFSRIPMEIYGMTGNAEYDKRKNEKREIYRKDPAPYWEWEPAKEKIFPPFPRQLLGQKIQ
jgi:hypothetical protein